MLISIDTKEALEKGLTLSEATVLGWLREVDSQGAQEWHIGDFLQRLQFVTHKYDTMYRILKSLVDKGLLLKIRHRQTYLYKLSAI